MLKNLKNKKKKKGFTLIELIIVIAIIAILAILAIPKFGKIRQGANEKSDIANAKTIANATTSLIAEGQITLPTSPDKKTLEIDDTKADADADKVEEYLQSVPKVKSVNGQTYFTAIIDDKGSVVVKAGTDTFFPKQ